MQRPQRRVEDQPDPDRGGQVDDDVADARQLEHRVTVQDRVVDEVKRAPVEQGPDVFERAGREVVDGVDLFAALEVGFG